eukprot:s832_g6.t1
MGLSFCSLLEPATGLRREDAQMAPVACALGPSATWGCKCFCPGFREMDLPELRRLSGKEMSGNNSAQTDSQTQGFETCLARAVL